MHKILICLVIILTLVCGSVAFGADKPELDTKTTLSIINTVMEFFYARHHGDTDKIRSMLTEQQVADNIDRWITVLKSGEEEKIEFTELYFSPENPLNVGVEIRILYGLESPPLDYLMILQKIGDKWKISNFDEIGIP